MRSCSHSARVATCCHLLLLLVCAMKGLTLDIPSRSTARTRYARRRLDSGTSIGDVSDRKNVQRHQTTFIQYNIMNGGNDRYEDIIRWLHAQDVDVVGLCELNGWQQGMRQRAQNANFKYSFLLEVDSGYNIGLLSRVPFDVVEGTTEGFERGMLHVQMIIDERVWHVFVVHLNAHNAVARLEESRVLAEKIENLDRESGDVVVVMGDLNTLSPSDAKEYEHELLLEYLLNDSTESRLAKKLVVGKDIFYEPLQLLLSNANLTDPCAESWNHCEPTVPTEISLDQAPFEDPRSNPLMRLDYVLVDTNAFRSFFNSTCEALRTPELGRLSDHYPVRCAFVTSPYV